MSPEDGQKLMELLLSSEEALEGLTVQRVVRTRVLQV